MLHGLHPFSLLFQGKEWGEFLLWESSDSPNHKQEIKQCVLSHLVKLLFQQTAMCTTALISSYILTHSARSLLQLLLTPISFKVLIFETA